MAPRPTKSGRALDRDLNRADHALVARFTARREASSPVCRKRPFTTQADRRRPRSQKRMAPSRWKLARLGRTLVHLVNSMQDLSARGVGLRVLTGQGAQIDTSAR